MRRTISWTRQIRHAFLLATLTFVICGSAIAALVGRPEALDPLLRQVQDPLDQWGIDVVGGNTADFPLPDGYRPRIARLTGMPTQTWNQDWTTKPWMDEFRLGAAGFLSAIAPTQDRNPAVARPHTADQFMSEWIAAPLERRVFLSFTSQDAYFAQQTERILAGKGYVTFIFLRVGDSSPPFHAGFVGRMFAEAGSHYVVDSPHARRSPGVWLEANLAQRLFDVPASPRPPMAVTMRPKPENEPSLERSQISRTPAAPPEVAPSEEMQRFLRGVRGDWIVTENPGERGKLFVHRTQTGNALVGLIYVVEVQGDGSWKVHRPRQKRSGTDYGEFIGHTKAPNSVSVGACGCR